MMTYLSTNDIAEILKISYEKALALVKYSGIKYVRIGNHYRVSEKEFNQFLQNNTYISCK